VNQRARLSRVAHPSGVTRAMSHLTTTDKGGKSGQEQWAARQPGQPAASRPGRRRSVRLTADRLNPLVALKRSTGIVDRLETARS
jgi:hypothetical protein